MTRHPDQLDAAGDARRRRRARRRAGAARRAHALRGLVGNIYLGKVVRVLPGMQSAFIDAGLERAAFLHVADIWRQEPLRDRRRGRTAARRARTDEVARDQRHESQPRADRAAGVRRPVAARAGRQGPDRHEGRAAVDADLDRRPAAGLPAAGRTTTSASRSGSATSRREQLRARIQQLLEPGGRGGFILRTNAEDASDEELAADIAYLRKLWDASSRRAAPRRRRRCCTRT